MSFQVNIKFADRMESFPCSELDSTLESAQERKKTVEGFFRDEIERGEIRFEIKEINL